jgi:hypothetical protein
LVIRFNSLSLTVFFAMYTLVQHKILVGQLQDEFDYLRSQIESLHLQLAQREVDPRNSPPGGINGGTNASNMVHIPYLNDLMESSEYIVKPKNDSG